MRTDSAARRAIVFEDNPISGRMIYQLLQSWGFSVVWVVKIRKVGTDGVLCDCLDPTTEPADELQHFLQWDEDTFDVILLDGQLGPTAMPKDGPHGWDLLPYIWQMTEYFIFIGSNQGWNQGMNDSPFLKSTTRKFSTAQKRNPDALRSDLERFLVQIGFLLQAEGTLPTTS
jgi:CheY-like chemotaxis protein